MPTSVAIVRETTERQRVPVVKQPVYPLRYVLPVIWHMEKWMILLTGIIINTINQYIIGQRMEAYVAFLMLVIEMVVSKTQIIIF